MREFKKFITLLTKKKIKHLYPSFFYFFRGILVKNWEGSYVLLLILIYLPINWSLGINTDLIATSQLINFKTDS